MPQSPFMKERLRDEFEAELHRLMHLWFPRTIDREHGGFLCNFNYRWKPSGPQLKMLEYQARETLAAARAAAHFPELKHLREAAAHGFHYLKETIWDHSLGGWYRMLDRAGKPLEGATKHGHGSAYAISACVACYELTVDPQCLELAKLAFTWLEEHAHDNSHGGYFVFYRRDGKPILAGDEGPVPSRTRDPIGTPFGFKDSNTTADLLACFADLYRVWPDTVLGERLEEMLRITCDRFIVAPGVSHMYLHPDWTPVPDFVRYGQTLHAAMHLLPASKALTGAVDPVSERVSTSVVDTMLRIAWDPNRGGFHSAGSSFGPTYMDDVVVYVRDKSWWVQADAMSLLLAIARLRPTDETEYLRHFARLWEYVKKYLIDAKYGGWCSAGLDITPEARKRPKAGLWKDCKHETEALLDCLTMLDSF
jgi:mannobiose 2-epimerase